MKKIQKINFEKLNEDNYRVLLNSQKLALNGGLVNAIQGTLFRELVKTGTSRLSTPDYQYVMMMD